MKLQSAMEYLMTYGWALLIIVVVLAVLFYLGVFNIGAAVGSTCNPYADYLCQNPVLSSNGNLIVNFGEIGSTMSITGTACSKGSASPSFNSISTINLESGQTTPLSFQCPVPSGRIGAPFSGTLWIQYTSATGTVLSAEIGSVSTSVSTSSNSAALGQNSVLYVPITITNTQNSPTPAPFQQMLTIDSAAYSNDINSAWSNVEFTTGPGATGTPLQAWIESGAGNTVSSTIVWVNLPSGIGANSNTVIYMNFMQSNVMSSSGPTGEAPQLSSTYGQYDNGASVFTHYGGGGSTGWSQFTYVGGTWSTANGYLQQTATSGGYNGGPAALIESASYPATGNYVLSMAFNYNTEADARVGIIAVATPTTAPDTFGYRFIGQQGSNGAGFLSFLNDLVVWVVNNNYQGAASTSYTMSITDAGGTWSGALYNGYGETSSPLTTLAATGYTNANYEGSTSGYIGISAAYYSSDVLSNPINVMWFYMRAYPPNGVMPSVSLGSAE